MNTQKLFFVQIFALILGCAHTPSEPVNSPFLPFNKRLKVDPIHYVGLPGVVLQNTYTISFYPGSGFKKSHALIKNNQLIQLLESDNEYAPSVSFTLGKHATLQSIFGRIIRQNGNNTKLSRSHLKIEPSYVSDDAQHIYSQSRKINFSANDAKPGQVVEIVTEIVWDDIRFLPTIFLDNKLPTKQASLIVNMPEGYQPNIQLSDNGLNFTQEARIFSTSFESSGIFGSEINGNQHILLFHSLPAYLGPDSEFYFGKNALQAQITLAQGKTGEKPERITNNRTLSEWFHENLIKSNEKVDLSKITALKQATSMKEKIAVLLKEVQDRLSLSETYGSIASTNFRAESSIASKQFATSRDKSILLKAYLEAIGIKSHFVLAPTKNNKPLLGTVVSPASIDAVLLAISTKTGFQFLDPSESGLTVGIVSPRISKRPAVILKPDRPMRVTLP